MSDNKYAELEEALRQSQRDWEKRLGAIQADRRHERTPLDRDSQDQAIQRENDETLDALDERGRSELTAIRGALARMESGTYGSCLGCGETIPIERLKAYPSADRCVGCA